MGQTNSGEYHPPTAEELSRRLTERFAQNCFTGVELYSFKDNFRTLADVKHSSESGKKLLYWTEDTLVRFLSTPECLDVGAILFRSASYIGAFPFPSLAPAILDFEALVKVVVIFTGRYKNVLRKRPDPLRLVFRSLGVYDRGITEEEEVEVEEVNGVNGGKSAQEDVDDDDDDDDLSLAALDALDAIEVFAQAERSSIHRARIPLDNLRKLTTFLLFIAPLEPNQPIAEFADRLGPDALAGVRETAESVLRGFKCRGEKGVLYRDFKSRVKQALPYMFDPLNPLFEHFLFSKKVDMSHSASAKEATEKPPLLSAEGQIMNLNTLSQLSFFIPGEQLWRRLRLLYAGSQAGFSMGSFESKVLKWSAPTLFLLSGTRVPDLPETHAQKAFLDRIPSKKYTGSTGVKDARLVYGVFLNTPWRNSHKDCFGDANSLLFQLEPTHSVFRASHTSPEYAFFNRDDGLGFGSPVPRSKPHQQPGYLNLGPVSLTLEHSLEYGVFQNTGSGGAFHPISASPEDHFQDVFEIEEIEVWGCGGDSEAEAQRVAWEWEEREALLRRQVNLGKDIEADRALLEMAGLIGQGRSGGST